MNHCALRQFPSPVTAAISQWTFANAPSFTHALQAAASRAWARRVSPTPKPASSAKNRLTLSSSRQVRSYGRTGPSCRLSGETFEKRCFATSGARGETLRDIDESHEQTSRPPRSRPSSPATAVISILESKAPDAHPSESLSTRHQCSLQNHDIDILDTTPGAPSGCHHLESMLNELDNTVHTVNARTSISTPFYPPQLPTKATLTPQARILSQLSPPTSSQSLSRNLRRSLNFKKLPTLPALIDYHDAYPQYRTTDSYNFLIELSIRHAQFGITRWLLDALILDKLARNSTTRLLEVRFLVRTGRWETAWKRVAGHTPEEALDKPLRNGRAPRTIAVPCHLWKELLGTAKRGATRYVSQTPRDPEHDSQTPDPFPLEAVEDPAPGTEPYLRRKRLLGCLSPVFTQPHKQLRPKLIQAVVTWSLRDGQGPAAEQLVRLFLSQLPSRVQEETAAQCMDIIHELLKANLQGALASPHVNRSRGLAVFYSNRRLLLSLLALQPFLKPSPATLRMILVPLRRAMRSGTIALGVVEQFRKKWGDQVIDDSVRMALVKLAGKEGRKDIVEQMMNETRKGQGFASTQTKRPSEPRGLQRPPDRELFPRRKQDNILWQRLNVRVRLQNRRGESPDEVE